MKFRRSTFSAFALLLGVAGCFEEEADLEEGRDCGPTSGYDCAEGYACVANACTAELAAGEPCKLGGESTSAVPCSDGLVCRSDDEGELSCQEPATSGDPCVNDSSCVAPEVCRATSPTAESRCAAPAAFGEFCAASADCAAPLRCRLSAVDGLGACGAGAEQGESCESPDACVEPLSCVAGGCR